MHKARNETTVIWINLSIPRSALVLHLYSLLFSLSQYGATLLPVETTFLQRCQSPLYYSIQSYDLRFIRAQRLQMSVSPLWRHGACALSLGHPLCVVFPQCTLFDSPHMEYCTPHLSFLSVEWYPLTLYSLTIATTLSYGTTLCRVEQEPS